MVNNSSRGWSCVPVCPCGWFPGYPLFNTAYAAFRPNVNVIPTWSTVCKFPCCMLKCTSNVLWLSYSWVWNQTCKHYCQQYIRSLTTTACIISDVICLSVLMCNAFLNTLLVKLLFVGLFKLLYLLGYMEIKYKQCDSERQLTVKSAIKPFFCLYTTCILVSWFSQYFHAFWLRLFQNLNTRSRKYLDFTVLLCW